MNFVVVEYINFIIIIEKKKKDQYICDICHLASPRG